MGGKVLTGKFKGRYVDRVVYRCGNRVVLAEEYIFRALHGVGEYMVLDSVHYKVAATDVSGGIHWVELEQARPPGAPETARDKLNVFCAGNSNAERFLAAWRKRWPEVAKWHDDALAAMLADAVEFGYNLAGQDQRSKYAQGVVEPSADSAYDAGPEDDA